ncbi:jg7224 [Pararge aegeria aegeria]|uniref:Jg7224 protein n=1 Tax=Pararge aegeria aegeria TaxID=348720 RepID=A0A8S4S5H6_9NEOP|nr:jg7224 [Pararge aegeria aegeria]
MGIVIKNVSFSVSLSLTALKIIGFWAPQNLEGSQKLLYDFYGFVSFMFLLGTYLIIQIVDLYLIWGNLPAMTATAFLLFTNFAHSTKIFNIYVRRETIQKIISEADTVLREEKSLEGREIVKRYPYNTSKSPAYEITYLHQIFALSLDAFLNVSKDTLVTTLIAQCRCRLRLVGLSLKNLCNEFHPIIGESSTRMSLTPSPKTFKLTQDQEIIVKKRLRCCVIQHQKALDAADQLQHCFSEPTFVQLNVSLVIICVTAFQLTASEELAGAAYEFPWYACSVPIRRSVIILMRRGRRITKLNAGGFTTLSLASFMAIIKTSYSMFTLLQQMDSSN